MLIRSGYGALVLLLGLFVGSARGEEATRLAAYQTIGVLNAEQAVTFERRPAAKGDRVDQTIGVSLELESTVRHASGEVEKAKNTIAREQERTLVVNEIVEGCAIGAQVRFAKYTRSADGETDTPPVVGKTFQCHRRSDDSLSVVAADGTFVSPDEFVIVSESMESFGRDNPLAEFLAGKTVRVGDVLEMPLEIGASLLSSDGAFGQVSKFEITLRSIDPATRVATFEMELESVGAQTTQMRLMVHGTIEVEPDTCRTRRLSFSGPMGMATTVGSYSSAETTFVRGKLKLEMTASYTDP